MAIISFIAFNIFVLCRRRLKMNPGGIVDRSVFSGDWSIYLLHPSGILLIKRILCDRDEERS